ncbi:UNVERIFIED_CONTAM: hypothetical protein FKN15_011087 [Acipenser sinensis]
MLLFYRYEIKSRGCWEKLCSAEFRELYALGSVDNTLYLLGGQMKLKKCFVVTNSVDRFSLERNQWRSSPPLPVPLACHAVVTLHSKLYVFGGWTPQTDHPDDEPDRLNNRMFQFDPGRDKWRECSPMKYSKYRFSTAVVNSEIYVLGGIGCLGADRGQARRCLDNVEIYNPDGDFWREGPEMPLPLLSLRTNATSAGVVEGKLYVCGGYHGADSTPGVILLKCDNTTRRAELFNSTVLPAMLYGAETWSLTAADRLKLAVTERAIERRMIGVKRTDRISNEQMRQMTKVKDAVELADKSKKSWASHLARRTDGRWTLAVTEWLPLDIKRPLGRPATRWRDQLRQEIGRNWMCLA